MLGDSLNTTVTVIATLQNSVVSYNTLTLTYILMVGIATQLVGIWGYWRIQKRYGLSTKTMFDFVMIGILLLDLWGMIGIWTHKIGYHHEWEFWLYSAVYGLVVYVMDMSMGCVKIANSFKVPMVCLQSDDDQ